jgi:N-acyl homoserine lactone hydrolase
MIVAPARSTVAGQVERLYVIDCGSAHATDQSHWSPGVNSGVPIDFSNNCYLIRHSSEGYLPWDTGIFDRFAARPNGVTVPAVGQTAPTIWQTWHRIQTLVSALAGTGVKPADLRYVAVSHVHPDHAGNVDEFPSAAAINSARIVVAARNQPPASHVDLFSSPSFISLLLFSD